VAMSKAAWQEIRVRSGRDDKFVARKLPIIQRMHVGSWLIKSVISTGAKRCKKHPSGAKQAAEKLKVEGNGR
jgi:hypothetical protein